MTINPKNLLVEYYPEPNTTGMLTLHRSGGIKVTHIPTGTNVVVDKHKHQHMNKEEALLELELLLEDKV